MKGTSIFTEYLQELTRYSAKIDRATISEKDHEALKAFRETLKAFREKLPEVTDYGEGGYINPRQKIILTDTVRFLIREAEAVIDLNKRVKQIEKEATAAARNAARKEARPE